MGSYRIRDFGELTTPRRCGAPDEACAYVAGAIDLAEETNFPATISPAGPPQDHQPPAPLAAMGAQADVLASHGAILASKASEIAGFIGNQAR